MRLGVLVLSVALVLAITLSPSASDGPLEWSKIVCLLCGRAAVADALANLLLFVPFGMALGLRGAGPRRAALLGAAFSLAVELVQLVVPGRDPSVTDLAANTLGTVAGVWLLRSAPRWARPPARVAARLSAAWALLGAGVLIGTDLLLSVSLPPTVYFGGSASPQRTGEPLRIGSNTQPGGGFAGRIDEVRVYRRSLTPEEIRADMTTPVAAGGAAAGLVAAYGFDEGLGRVLQDVSGHGHTGHIQGAAWAQGGRFGGALVFDGRDDVVVVPAGPLLELGPPMTLEAWVHPTEAQRGWRTVLQKEFDAYFLLASSRAGALRAAGGGTFGLLTESVTAPRPLPRHAWTHVAVTYDGTELGFYVDGELVGRRRRWYPGPVLDTAVNGLAIPAGLVPQSAAVRSALLSGAPLQVRAVAAPPVETPAPLATLHDAVRNEILVLAAEGSDLVFRLRTRAAALELDSPALRAPGALREVRAGDDLRLALSRERGGYCVEVNSRTTCGYRYTVGAGWALLAYGQVPAGPLHWILNDVWLAAILLPFGYWARRRWESLVGILVLASSVVLACTSGSLAAPAGELGAAVVGLLAGCIVARVLAVPTLGAAAPFTKAATHTLRAP